MKDWVDEGEERGMYEMKDKRVGVGLGMAREVSILEELEENGGKRCHY